MNIHEIPFDQLNEGDRVASSRGRPGTISKLDKNDDSSIWVTWSTDGIWKNEEQTTSHQYHHQPAPKPILYIGK